jgi:hypothetical protein
MAKRIIIISVTILVTIILSGCSVGNSNNETQEKINTLEEQNKQQQEELEELKSATNAKAEGEFLTKKEDCERRIKFSQGELDNAKAKLVKDRNWLNELIAGTCEGCYKDCHRQLKEEGKCEEIRDDSVEDGKSTVAKDENVIKEKEMTLTSLKAECEQYLQN